MPWLELLTLVEGLPENSATKAALTGDRADRRWTQQTWLMAYQINLLQLLIRIQWTSGGIKGNPDLHAVDVPNLERAPSQADGRRARLLEEMARRRPRNRSADPGDLAALDAALKSRLSQPN